MAETGTLQELNINFSLFLHDENLHSQNEAIFVFLMFEPEIKSEIIWSTVDTYADDVINE